MSAVGLEKNDYLLDEPRIQAIRNVCDFLGKGKPHRNIRSQNDLQLSFAKDHITRIRAFVEAVLAYTGANQINIIGHSMGVTISRAVIQGGTYTDFETGQTYSIGPSLRSKVKTFVGIAGGNQGIALCWLSPYLRFCNKVDGYYPGLWPASGPSKFLSQLN